MLIGNVEIENNVCLAPMAGVNDMAFRLICKGFGCGLVFTEMISAKGLYYNNENTFSLTQIDNNERPVAFQIFGKEPEIMAYSAVRLESLGADIIDINMGCPTPKIVNNGDGCALMKEPLSAGKIINAVTRTVDIPVTVKIRKGWDNENINAVEMAVIAEENGAKAITVHGRTRQEFYSGKADWNIIKEVKDNTTIPIIGNGDIYTPWDAKSIIEETNCDGIMIGRGAQGNPWIFDRILKYLKNGELIPEPTAEEKIKMIIKHLNNVIEIKGEYTGIKEMRKHIAWYLKGLPKSNSVKNQLFSIEDKKRMYELLTDYLYLNSSKHE